MNQSKEKKCRIQYIHPCDIRATRDEKLQFLALNPLRKIQFETIKPDTKNNWINLTDNDFDTLIPLASKDTKAAKTAAKERAIFKLFSLGVVTARDEWVYDDDATQLEHKVSLLINTYNADLKKLTSDRGSDKLAELLDSSIKWTRAVKNDLRKGIGYTFNPHQIIEAMYRPFVKRELYFSSQLNEMRYQTPLIFGDGSVQNRCIVLSDPTAQKPWMISAVDQLPDLHFVGAAAGTLCFPLERLGDNNALHDNITDWGLKQFRQQYTPLGKRGAGGISAVENPPQSPFCKGGSKTITKEAIFHYCYAVLHDPLYREKYALNLKREFPRIPFYADFWQWAAWGEALMKLHIGYEAVEPFKLQRTDIPDEKARAAQSPPPQPSPGGRGGNSEKQSSILAPKPLLRADKDAGSITLDSETTLRGIPPEAWDYKLGNRCALEWVLDQYKEKKPKDPTIREKFDTYRFADYKEKVIDLLMRVTTVSVETERITRAMKAAAR